MDQREAPRGEQEGEGEVNVIRHEPWDLIGQNRIVSIDGFPVGPVVDPVIAQAIVMWLVRALPDIQRWLERFRCAT